MNKQAELTRWTPKRLLSLLMALIMTLSLLPTAALAAAGDYTGSITGAPDQLITNQQSADITATLNNTSSADKNVGLRLTVSLDPTATGGAAGNLSTVSVNYNLSTSPATASGASSVSSIDLLAKNNVPASNSISDNFNLAFGTPGKYLINVKAFEDDGAGGDVEHILYHTTITVKDAIDKLVVDPANPEAGQPFTVTAMTNVDNGNVLFKYDTQFETVKVLPLGSGSGYARHTFTAETSVANVTAEFLDAAGIIDTKTATVNVGAPATYHTVVFRANGDNVYSLPAPQPVKSGEMAAEPIAPERKGYTFDGWYDSAGTKYNFADPVTANLELYAKWTAKKITINFENLSATEGVKISPDVASTQFSVDSVAHFGVTVPDKYNTSDLFVWIGETHAAQTYLVPVERYEGTDPATGKPFVTLYYQFPVRDDMADPTKVVIGPVTAKTFTVMMPTGHFTAQITSVSGTAQAAGTTFANVEHGGSYTFTVTPDKGYTIKRVAVNGATIGKNNDGSYTVSDVTTAQTVEVVVDELPVYIVIYNSNNSQYAFQRVTEGSKATLPADPVVEGYTFGGWYTEQNGAGTQFTAETGITGDITVYAKLTAKTYQISYNANTTDTVTNMPTANQLKTHGLAEKLSETVPTREGYTFLGWGTTENATAASYQPGDMYSVDGDITLYAVWQQKTYTITFSSGEGYTLHSGHGSMTVADGENFDFNLIVDPAYAQNAPEVWTNTTGVGTGSKLTNPVAYTNPVDGSKQYHYTLTNVKADTAVNVKVTANATYTVTFMTNGTPYQTQQVEFNHKATQPVDPKVEGYTFGGWYKDAGLTTPWDFATEKVIGPTTIYAKLDPITPKITWPTTTTGYEFKFTAPPALVGNTSGTGTVAYKDVVTFTITINDGYDASQMQVGINGVYHAAKDITDNVYTYEFIAKEDTKITVTGIERKTVTVIYNANARDDVSGLPSPQVVKYYLAALGETGNDKITTQVPSRTGYTFLGWNTDSEAKKADARYTAEKIRAGAASEFTQDTTLYAIWEADALTAELIITDEFTSAPSGTTISGSKLEYAYEGDSITLVGKLSADAQGTMTFYKKAKTATAWTFLGTTSINGGNYGVLGTTVENYKWGNADETATKSNYRWEYKVEFKPTTDEGYSPCEASDDLRVYSKAISWEVDKKTDKTNFDWIKAQNELTIYTDEARTAATDKMTANSTYWLQIPAVYELDGGLNLKNNNITKLSVGTHYEITWEYEDSANHWTTYTTTSDTDWVKVTPEYSGYSFRAKVTPTQSSIYTKAATYDENGTVVKDVYWDYLITKATTKTEKQATATELAITGADAENSVTIAGTSVTTGLAQFEGQKVTLTATVTETTTGTPAVTTGFVNFYRKGATDTLLNASPIAVGTNGVATCEVEISKWTDGKSVTENKDEFYAVYLANATYDTSDSKTTPQTVYIKSTTIKTPIIESTLEGEGGKKATTYTDNLTGLLAGVEHTFKLRTGNDKADWSVVALDGRTVAAENYEIEWQYKTTGNFAKADNDSTAAIYTTKTTKFGDQYRVVLNAKGDMTVGATSKVAEIGKKQDVTVTVEASDEIKSTAETDVYQLNDITLTATVAAKETTSTMKPTGTVKFYYKDKQVNPYTFVYLGEATLEKGTDGKMHASIETNKLPVDKDNNTKLDVVVCAAYFGDDTFAASRNVNATTGNIAYAGSTGYVTYDTVTVYSSVVYAGDSENKATTTPSTDGITITANGKLKANEAGVTLTLGQVYTLDHPIDLSKLTYNTDYTVQWQILENALQHQDSGSAGSYASTTAWKDLSGQTGMNYTGTMEQDAAYRAKITVKDTPIAKGSFTKVDQAIKGRDVYYSNVLVVGAGMATVTTNITTSANQKFNEEGIVSGETATIHVLASGAAKTTPISTVTATITKSGATEPVFNEKANNVNGYTSFAWDTANLTPGYYTLTVTAESNNGYAPQTITRTLIVRDNAYTLSATTISKVYNGKAQGIDWELTGVDIEDALAQKSVVVYYYDKDGKMVEPTQAGEYQYDLYLPASAYWTELEHVSGTFTIEKRPVEVVDLVAQAKVYDGTNNANIQEIILNDSAVDSDGTTTGDKGIIDGDSVYAVGTGYTSKDTAGTDATLGVKDVSLKGDDAANYTLSASGYTEVFNIQRSQVKGAIVSGRTYKYTGKDIKLAASDIYLIDQAGNQLTNYDVTYYYHNGDGVEKVDAMNKMGKYTVIARPEQNNYKGGATETVYVGNTDTPGTLNNGAKSSLITISNTVELYGARTGVTVSATKGTATASYYYDGAWKDTAPTNAGRYLVKATVTNDGVTDTAYGIYTIVKARPEFTPTTDKPIMEYTSGRYDGTVDAGLMSGSTAETYITYTGGTIQGVAYEAPTEVGKYIATVHVGETANYTAHEKQVAFEITPKALTITADDLQRWQYGSFPDMVASYQGLATKGIAADTSLRDVQIQPEFLFNEQNGGYTNHAFDQVGTYPVTVRNALARNYTVTYVGGTIATTAEEPKAELAIHGMPDNGTTTTENLVYYGDTIQLYAYGYYKTLDSNTSGGSYNTSSLIEWSVSDASIAEIDQSGLLTIKGVGTFTVTLTRGSGSAAISTTINVEAKPKEVSIDVPDVDKVYTASEQIYDSSPTVNGLINSDSVTPTVTAGTDKRTVVGSQITSYTVNDAKYVSETYGGLFTINVKDVTVKPTAATVTYGDTLGTPSYTEPGIITGTPALTDGKAVSEREDYKNLDVLNGYEILVAGRENENYNVKYVTDQDAPDVEVTAKDLTIKTGTLNEQTGMTSGSLNPMGKYPVNGAAVDSAIAMGPSNVRMYGEPNWVMDKDPVTLISGDTLADLAALNGELVSFNYNIGADANVSYTDKATKLTVSGSAMSDYEVLTDASKMAFKNYNETYTLGTQNIYQRPVTLSVPSGMTLTAYKPSILDSSNQVKNDVLLNLLLNNLIVSKYNNEGGLAELLKHTIKDLNIQIKSTQVTGDKLTVKIALGNQNYWLNSANEQTFEITLVTEKIVPKYSTLDWTSFSVTMYDAEGKAPVSVNGAVNFYIFKKKDGADLKYSDYKNDPIIRSGPMTPTGSTGQYVASFERLPAGEYAYFAIAQNYTIVE